MKIQLSRAVATAATIGMFSLLGASDAAAQACMGNPAGMGQAAASGNVAFTDGATSYGASLGANLTGPLAVEVGYALTDYDGVDSNGNTFAGAIGYEVPGPQLSICPSTGLSFSSVSATNELNGVEGTVSNLAVPLRLGVGKTLSAGGQLEVTPYVAPQFFWARTSYSESQGGASVSSSETSSEMGADLGLLLGSERIYGGASLSLTTIDNSDPVIGLGLGLLF